MSAAEPAAGPGAAGSAPTPDEELVIAEDLVIALEGMCRRVHAFVHGPYRGRLVDDMFREALGVELEAAAAVYRRLTGRDYGGDAASRRASREARAQAHALAVRTLHEWDGLQRKEIRTRVALIADVLEMRPLPLADGAPAVEALEEP